MANITNPIVTLGTSSGGSRNVTVSGTLTFDASDVGRTYKLEIGVYGDDNAADKRPSDDSAADDLVYTFKWPGFPLPRAYKNVTVAAAGNVALSETRAVPDTALDEDKGVELIGMADINTPIFMPRADEVYAKVTLSTASISKVTPPVQSGLGV